MQTIPANASLVFEFNNDASFFDIFRNNPLFTAVAGRETVGDLDTLRQQVLKNAVLNKYFSGQNIFISVHPTQNKQIALLVTLSAAEGFGQSAIDEVSKQPGSGLLITPLQDGTKKGYTFYINALKKRFYLISNENNIYAGSFSKDLIDELSAGKRAEKTSFVLLSEQQNANSLANLYVNYSQLDPLFDCLFQNKNTDVFKRFRLLAGLAALMFFRASNLLITSYGTFSRQQQPIAQVYPFPIRLNLIKVCRGGTRKQD